MSVHEDVEYLWASGFFAGCSAEHLRLIGFGAKRWLCREPGEQIFAAGEPSRGGYIVCTGACEALSAGGGSEKPVRTFPPGTLLNREGLFYANTHGFTVKTKEPGTLLLLLERRHFLRVVESYPELISLFRTRLAEELEHIAENLENFHRTAMP